jgi:hypothetical protein
VTRKYHTMMVTKVTIPTTYARVIGLLFSSALF